MDTKDQDTPDKKGFGRRLAERAALGAVGVVAGSVTLAVIGAVIGGPPGAVIGAKVGAILGGGGAAGSGMA
jgi:hypothetical protein